MDADDEMSDDTHHVRNQRQPDWTKERREREEESWGDSGLQELLREGPPLGALPAADAESRAGPGREP